MSVVRPDFASFRPPFRAHLSLRLASACVRGPRACLRRSSRRKRAFAARAPCAASRVTPLRLRGCLARLSAAMGDDYLFHGDGDDEFGSLAPAARRLRAPAAPDGLTSYVSPLVCVVLSRPALRAAARGRTGTRGGGCGGRAWTPVFGRNNNQTNGRAPCVVCGQPRRCAVAQTDRLRAPHVRATSCAAAAPVAPPASRRCCVAFNARWSHAPPRAPFLASAALRTTAATTTRP